MNKTNLKLLNKLLNGKNFDKQLATRYLINQNVEETSKEIIKLIF